jgi:beta-glucanase (GH16 family)
MFPPLAAAGQATAPSTTGTSEKLVWVDEFTPSSEGSQPDPANWKYEVGGNGWGNRELETYCAYGSDKPPCRATEPNAYVGADGYLHIVARQNLAGQYTSARLLSQDLKSFQYGRMEARIKIPAGEGLWPAFWMLGDDIAQVRWPACGEFDIMESIGKEPGTIHGSIHGKGFIGASIGLPYTLPDDMIFSAAFHRFGLLWSPGKVQYYVDDPNHPYATFTPADLPAGAIWPFDEGKFFFLLNLAVGGNWPGRPDESTHFPAEMLVDYVRVWQRAK